MQVVQNIVYVLLGLAKFFGFLVFGLGVGWLIVQAITSIQKSWQVEVTFLASVFALMIALARYAHAGLSGMALGFGIAVFLWGLPQKVKKGRTK